MIVLVTVILLSSVLLSSAQQQDQIVSKAFPANITCQRNSTQRNIERQQAVAIGGTETLLVALNYNYIVMLFMIPRCMQYYV